MSKLEVNTIEPQCGTTLTVGESGGSVRTGSNNLQASDGGNLISQSGTTITVGASGDTVSLASGASQSGFGRSGTVDWQTGSIKTSTFTATNGEGYFCNTNGGAFTVNLPAGTAGHIVAFSDYTRTFGSNKLTISPNGSEKIGGQAYDAELTVDGQSATFVYVDSTEGWININETQTSQTGVAPAYIAATGGNQPTATGCIVCTNYKVHKFTGPGTFTITAGSGPLSKLDYLVMAGGGGGGGGEPGYWSGGGGGAGGFRESKTAAVSGCWTASPLVDACGSLGPFSAPTAIPVTVGAAGTKGVANNPGCSATAGGNGGNSIFSTITATGGGGGGISTGDTSGTKPARSGKPGGSGGGSGGGAGAPAGTGNTPPTSPAQGQNGGVGSTPSSGSGGGGGGAGGVGETWPGPVGGNCCQGGPSVTSHITASPVAYAEGGTDSTGSDGAVNTGKGGGSNSSPGTVGAGGSGIVIIRYRFQ